MEKSNFEVRATCKDCRFSDTIVNPQSGPIFICRNRPPTIAYAFMPKGPGEANVISNSLWPVIASTDWCSKLEMKAN